MSKKGIAYREVSSDFIYKWEEDGWKAFYEKHKEELFLGIRTGNVKLYYKRGWIIKFEYLKRSKRLRATLNDTYCSDLENRFKNLEVTCEDLTDELLEEIKEKVNGKYGNGYKEYVTQQNLFIKNNSLTKPDWYCIDMEYEESKRGKGTGRSGEFRFDIIALKDESEKEKPNIALIELKHGNSAIKDNSSEDKKKSGVYGHLNDFYKLYKCDNSKGSSKNVLQENIQRLIESYKGLVSNFPDIDEQNFKINPKFYIIFMDSNEAIKEEVYQCIAEGNKSNKDYSFIDSENGVYIEDGNKKFECEFLFSKETGLDIEKLKINAILNSSQYEI